MTGGVPIELRIALMRQHGSFPQAYSAAIQEGLEHFGDENGFLAYKMVHGTAMVLGDPVAPRQHYDRLIQRFRDRQDDLCFCYASRAVAEILAPLGYNINEMGAENRIDIATYDFAGRDKRNVRQSFNRIASLGYTIRESSISAIGPARIEALSQAWKKTRPLRTRETSFISRPMVFHDEPDVRTIFVLAGDGTLVAYAVFDPVYEDGQVVAYTSQHNRHRPDADSLVQHAIRRHAIELFRAEGMKWLFLGLSPFDGIEDKDFAVQKNWLVRRAFRFAYTSRLFNRFIYPLQTLSAHKRQFRATTYQVYFAFNRLPSLPRVLKLLRACDIV